jgi:hypothetical protein
MKAIPTRYKGVQFRSRLEARWAAMFDLLEWPWEYEPVDLEGYIPDFVLMFPAGGVLVEIKPEFTARGLHKATDKIDKAGWESTNENDALVLGATWNIRGESASLDYPLLGIVRQISEPELPMYAWCEAEWICCRSCSNVSTYHFAMGWYCSYCGTPGKVYGEPPHDLQAYWAEAGNAVQWKPRR